MGFRLIVLRHGETEWNRQGRYQGCIDTRLSQEGRAQARAASQALASRKLAAVYSSQLTRAKETAEMIAAHHRVAVSEDSAFAEICHGLWEGLTVEEARAEFPDLYAAWRERPGTVTMPGGENLAQVRDRVLDRLERLRTDHDGGTVCLVTHGSPLRLVLLDALGCSLDRFWMFHCGSTGVSEIEYEDGRPILHRVNSAGHLDREAASPDHRAH
ncbi:MAG: histidine phosphatase family protein [Candidatus Rokubacteria bacterium]|nr:histidine phosphatase family protein [Candidatus Rokubacteria bacterium]